MKIKHLGNMPDPPPKQREILSDDDRELLVPEVAKLAPHDALSVDAPRVWVSRVVSYHTRGTRKKYVIRETEEGTVVWRKV
jgi:6-phosphogluconolactonase/glucosamine-6-phosphate isomerase/deaminase